jgi:hypothetical protein
MVIGYYLIKRRFFIMKKDHYIVSLLIFVIALLGYGNFTNMLKTFFLIIMILVVVYDIFMSIKTLKKR